MLSLSLILDEDSAEPADHQGLGSHPPPHRRPNLAEDGSSADIRRRRSSPRSPPAPALLRAVCLLLGRARRSAAAVARSAYFRRAVRRAYSPVGLPLLRTHLNLQVETEDGFLLAVQRIPHGRLAYKRVPGPPVFLQHGLFQGGDTWFMNSCEESLGFLLADSGFDVWVGNVRGTRWSYGHTKFAVHDKEFWDWSWQELAQYDLMAMISYVYSATNSTVSYVGHSQGTIMALAALTMPDFVEMIDSAALLCPISYLDHISSKFVLRAVSLDLDQILMTIGIHQLNFRSEMGIEILDLICDGHVDCNDLLSAITGANCCFNMSLMDFYLDYEPHPSSTRNLHHLFQMIRKGTFAKYDYGLIGNLKHYGSLHPPVFDLADIPTSLPMWMAYGGNDALADVTDVQRTIEELKSQPELLYIEEYGHIDFIMGVKAKDDLYGQLIRFLKSRGSSSRYYNINMIPYAAWHMT